MDLTDPKSILAVQIGKIGDMILTTPLFSEIKKIFPDSKLTVLASSINKDIPLNHSSVDEVLIFKKNLSANILLLNSSLWKQDLWIDTKDNYSRTSELLLKIFKPKNSMGFNFEKKVFGISLNEWRSGDHAIDVNLSPVNYFKRTDKINNVNPSFNIPSDVQKKIGSVIKVNPYLKKVLLNVSAGDISRYIKNENWISIINKIHNSGLYYFYITGLAKDIDNIDYILNNTRSINIKYINTGNIIETAELVRICDYVISADTSIIHICSAFNRPLVGIYPDVKWNLKKFFPLSDNCEVVVSGNKNTIDDVKADDISNAFKRLVTSGNAESRTRVRKEDH